MRSARTFRLTRLQRFSRRTRLALRRRSPRIARLTRLRRCARSSRLAHGCRSLRVLRLALVHGSPSFIAARSPLHRCPLFSRLALQQRPPRRSRLALDPRSARRQRLALLQRRSLGPRLALCPRRAHTASTRSVLAVPFTPAGSLLRFGPLKHHDSLRFPGPLEPFGSHHTQLVHHRNQLPHVQRHLDVRPPPHQKGIPVVRPSVIDPPRRVVPRLQPPRNHPHPLLRPLLRPLRPWMRSPLRSPHLPTPLPSALPLDSLSPLAPLALHGSLHVIGPLSSPASAAETPEPASPFLRSICSHALYSRRQSATAKYLCSFRK